MNEIKKHSQADPFSMLPPTVAAPLIKLWAMNADVIPDPTPTILMVRGFMDDHNIKADALASIIAKMTSPESMARYKFGADLKTDLADRCDQWLNRKQSPVEIEAQSRAFKAEPMFSSRIKTVIA